MIANIVGALWVLGCVMVSCVFTWTIGNVPLGSPLGIFIFLATAAAISLYKVVGNAVSEMLGGGGQ